MFEKLKEIWGVHRMTRRLNRAQATLTATETRAETLAALGRELEARLELRAAEFRQLRERLDADLRSADRLKAKYESSLEELRDKADVMQETINTLTASHKLLLARYDAETAIQVRLRGAAQVPATER